MDTTYEREENLQTNPEPELYKHVEDLDSVLENVTSMFVKREENLFDAIEKAMKFYDTQREIEIFLDSAEVKFGEFSSVSSDIHTVKGQIDQLKVFKENIDGKICEIESVIREGTSLNQDNARLESLSDIYSRWQNLSEDIVEREEQLEKTLLSHGHFQLAEKEFILWFCRIEKSCNKMKPLWGDPEVIQVVLGKLRILTNNLMAHKNRWSTINTARQDFLISHRGRDIIKVMNRNLNDINDRWDDLENKICFFLKELENALEMAQLLQKYLQIGLTWAKNINEELDCLKPFGSSPETIKEQIYRCLDLYSELDLNRCEIENIIQQGDTFLKRSGESSAKSLQHNLHILKQRWNGILTKANDLKFKLEIAFEDATEFHDALEKFVEWITIVEKYLSTLKPVSRHLESILQQIDEHMNFYKDVGAHREVMINLDKKGTYLKYFIQKQDIIYITNLLISVQHRWKRMLSKAAERTRALDHGYKEYREFHDAWTSLSTWIDEAENSTAAIGNNDPAKIKELLSKHKEFQRTLGSKQITYNATMKSGCILKDKCLKPDVQLIQSMMNELKQRWNKVCAKSVDRQHTLVEALLFSGQFKEAALALFQWLRKVMFSLKESKECDRDLDTVTLLIDQNKIFKEELKSWRKIKESVREIASDLKLKGSSDFTETIATQLDNINAVWESVNKLCDIKQSNLDEAFSQISKISESTPVYQSRLSTEYNSVSNIDEAVVSSLKNIPLSSISKNVSYKSPSSRSSRSHQGSQPYSRVPSNLTEDAVHEFKNRRLVNLPSIKE